MKTVTIALFVLGLLVSFTAFAADHATSIPWVLRLFAPHYYHATNPAGKTLDEQKTLTPADEGFQEIQEIFMGLLARQLPKLPVSVARFTRGTAMLGFSESCAREMIPLDVELSVGQKLQWDLTARTSSSLHTASPLHFAMLLWLSLVAPSSRPSHFCSSFLGHAIASRTPAPNHAMERTSGSFGSKSLMKFHPQPAATRSPASRRSSCSR